MCVSVPVCPCVCVCCYELVFVVVVVFFCVPVCRVYLCERLLCVPENPFGPCTCPRL